MLKVAGGMEERRLQQLFLVYLPMDAGKRWKEKEWIGRSRKKYCQFFQSGLKNSGFRKHGSKRTEKKNFLEQKSRSLLSSPSEDSRINSMIRFIEEHYREDISAADLSERFGLSASYISSLLKTALGVRYSDYVAGLRLNHAKELLATTHMTVKDITVECAGTVRVILQSCL